MLCPFLQVTKVCNSYLIASDLYLPHLQENALLLPSHRSSSVPAFTKEGNATFGGMFRIVRSISQMNEKIATTTFPTDETGKIYISSLL